MKRYEREIEEILQKIVDFPSENSVRRTRRPKRSFLDRVRAGIPAVSPTLTTGNLTFGAILLAILGFALRDFAPSVAPLASMAAVALFVAVIVESLFRRRPRYEKRWRGQVIEFPRKKLAPWNELRFRITILWRSLRWWMSRH